MNTKKLILTTALCHALTIGIASAHASIALHMHSYGNAISSISHLLKDWRIISILAPIGVVLLVKRKMLR